MFFCEDFVIEELLTSHSKFEIASQTHKQHARRFTWATRSCEPMHGSL